MKTLVTILILAALISSCEIMGDDSETTDLPEVEIPAGDNQHDWPVITIPDK